MAEPARANAEQPRRVTVSVAGREFRLRTDQDEALTALAAERVTREIERAKGGQRAPSGSEALILVALNLAGEVLALERERDRKSQEVAERLERLIGKLQQGL